MRMFPRSPAGEGKIMQNGVAKQNRCMRSMARHPRIFIAFVRTFFRSGFVCVRVCGLGGGGGGVHV